MAFNDPKTFQYPLDGEPYGWGPTVNNTTTFGYPLDGEPAGRAEYLSGSPGKLFRTHDLTGMGGLGSPQFNPDLSGI